MSIDVSDKTKVPVLEEVIVQGKEMPNKSLSKSEIKAIIEITVQSAVAEAIVEMKAYVDNILPTLIEEALNSNGETELALKPVENGDIVK